METIHTLLKSALSMLLIPSQQQTAVETTPPRSAQEVATGAALLPGHVQIGTDATKPFTEADFQRLTVHLAGLITLPINRIRVLERYHRVFLVSYVPYGHIDPVLPITAVSLGDSHDAAYRLLSNALAMWTPEGDYQYGMTYHRDFYYAANQHASICAAAAAEHLRPDEAAYYATQMLYSVAKPDRNRLHI